MKVLLATEKPFAPVAVNMMREVITSGGHEFETLENYRSFQELLAAVSDVDALIVRSDKVNPETIKNATKLKVVVRAGAGYDNIDLEACTRQKVVAMNTPGQNSNAVAELAFEMMLYMARSGFGGKSGTELRGKTLGLHGFGNIGKFMAEIAKGFGMQISAFDPFIVEQEFARSGVRVLKTTQELYSNCQYVSLHIPVNESTKFIVGYDLLKLMPENAVLINTARRELVDEEGLLKIFAERDDFKFLSDGEPVNMQIFEEKYIGRFIFTTKKMGAQTEEANINAGVAAARQVVDYFNTGNEKFRLNK